MEKHELEKFKEKLLKLRSDITKLMETQEQPTISWDGLDEADQASAIMDNIMDSAVSTNYQAELNKIEESLKRIESGEFGYCLACKKDIPTGRLEVLPFTIYCMDCQKNAERRHRR